MSGDNSEVFSTLMNHQLLSRVIVNNNFAFSKKMSFSDFNTSSQLNYLTVTQQMTASINSLHFQYIILLPSLSFTRDFNLGPFFGNKQKMKHAKYLIELFPSSFPSSFLFHPLLHLSFSTVPAHDQINTTGTG